MSDQDTNPPNPPVEDLDRYLLGRLSDAESDALEGRLLHDARFFEEAEMAEDDLVDRYDRGELSAEDRKRFERHLLPAPRIRDRVRVARALRDVSQRRIPAPVHVPVRRTVRWAWAAALVAALTAGALGFEVVRLHDRLDDATTEARIAQVPERAQAPQGAYGDVEDEAPLPFDEPAAPRPAEPHDEEPPSRGETDAEAAGERIASLEQELNAARETIASLSEESSEPSVADSASNALLFLGLATRSTGDENVLEMGDAAFAEIQVDLGRRRPSGTIRAAVTRDGVPVWESDAEVVTADGESMARLSIPRESLATGDYRVTLFQLANGENEEFMAHSFSVTR